jgi:GT2 family glycosyltransferase
MNPRILVGCPTAEIKSYCLEEYINGLKKLTYPFFDVMLVDNSKKSDYFNKLKKIAEEWRKEFPEKNFFVERIPFNSPKSRKRIVDSRNLIRKKAINGNYDYFFSLEQDVIPPVNVIETFLSRKKEVVSGVYFNAVPGGKGVIPLAFTSEGIIEGKEKFVSVNLFDLFPSRLITGFAFIGIGCMFISRKIFTEIEFRFDESFDAFDDYFFCKDVQEKEFKVYLDSSVFCRHLFKQWITKDNF